jgi:hypothetical protein
MNKSEIIRMLFIKLIPEADLETKSFNNCSYHLFAFHIDIGDNK